MSAAITMASGKMLLRQVYAILRKVLSILQNESSILALHSDTIVCGDIHGNMSCLSAFLKCCGMMECNYLFLGDYVDRGPESLQCLISMLYLKSRFPDRIHLLRGNHETFEPAFCTYPCSLYADCLRCYGNYCGEQLFHEFLETFTYLPLAAIVADKFFCVHAGIPVTLNMNEIQKPTSISIPTTSPVYSVLWSDVHNCNSAENSSLLQHSNVPSFSLLDSCQMLQKYNLIGIVRGHQNPTGMIGYAVHHFQRVLTITGICDEQFPAAVLYISSSAKVIIMQYKLKPKC